MKQAPIETFYNPELSIAHNKEMIDVSSQLLKEEIDWTVNFFFRCFQSSKNKVEEEIAIFMLYRHVIEMTDGINELLRQCCPKPSLLLLRSSFEALLSLDYIFEKDTTIRALACYHSFLLEEEKYGKSLLTDYKEGSEHKKALSEDKYLAGTDIKFDEEDTMKILKEVEEELQNNKYAKINSEREKIIKGNRGNKYPKWYSYFNGPRSLYKLSIHLKRQAQYLNLYNDWSRKSHAIDFSQVYLKNDKSGIEIKQIRAKDEFVNVSSFTSLFLIEATRMMIKNYREEEEKNFVQWYSNQIKPLNNKLDRYE